MTLKTSAPHLVATKLNQPRFTSRLVQRKRLYKALDLQRPLTIVVAPAGYGKTTLVSTWAAHSGLPCSWLSLDPSDDHLSVFVDYFLASVERLFPDVVRTIAVGPNRATTTSFVAVARKLADALDGIDEHFTIILDDYNFIDEPDIHHFLVELLRFPPRGLNLVISSRADPPLPLAALRARAQLAEIRTDDLRFTLEETADYLRQELNQAVDPKTLALVEESTEGWVAGLHLAALYLQNQGDTGGAAAQLKGNNRFTIDYLALEVLAKQGPETQSFLVKTAILQRMCPALCDAILAPRLIDGPTSEPMLAQGRRILDYLDSQNLFITTLDDDQQWYRYHHLFQQLLESRLRATHSSDAIAALYSDASRWCAEQGLIDEAITYATATGDIATVIVLIEEHRHPAMNAERWHQLERWLNLLQRPHIDAHPQLLLLEAWVCHKRQRLAEIPARLDLAEALLAEGHLPHEVERHLHSEIDALRSQQYFHWPDATLAYHTAQRALENAPAAYASVRGVAWVFLGAGLYLAGGLEAALAALGARSGNGYAAQGYEYSRILMIKCYMFWMAGDLPNLNRMADELLRYAEQHDLPESVIWAHYFHGCACYQQNDLPAAYEDFSEIMNSRHVAAGFVLIQGAFGCALVLQAQGNADAAIAAAATVLDYAQKTNNSVARQEGQAFGAYLALLQGRLDDAFGWSTQSGRGFTPAPIVTFFAPPLARAAILLQHHTQTSLNEAEQLLRQMETYLATTHGDRFRCEVLALQSLLYARREQRVQALQALEEAITLAEPCGLHRVFLDLGPTLQRLLAELTLSGSRGAFVRQLCAAHLSANLPANAQVSVRTYPSSTEPTSTASVSAAAQPRLSSLVQPRHPDLIELLTNRELEVLQLLALRLTNKEIALALGISTGTVKQHTINVFRKLHVENRREAILQARAMGFQLESPYPL